MKESARCFRGRRCTLSEPDKNYCVGDVEGFLSDFFTFLCFFAFSVFSVFSGIARLRRNPRHDGGSVATMAKNPWSGGVTKIGGL